MLFHVLIVCSLLLLSSIPVNGYDTVFLSTPLLRDILFLAVMDKAAVNIWILFFV